MIIGKTAFYKVWKRKISTVWKKRRFKKIMQLVQLPDKKIKVLEVGCANGMDFIQFLDRDKFEIWGVDIDKNSGVQEWVNFVSADAAELPFEDGSFDLVVSIGLLEHIEPMEKLCEVIHEFERVGKNQISVVPSISTILEPHSCKLFFPQRLHTELCSEQEGIPLHLNFLSEHTWTKFNGFCGCKIKRFFYLPPFIMNTVIYK